jgi:hypothetical protein
VVAADLAEAVLAAVAAERSSSSLLLHPQPTTTLRSLGSCRAFLPLQAECNALH